MNINKYNHLAHIILIRHTSITPHGTARYHQYEGEEIDWGNTTPEQRKWIEERGREE